MSPTDTRRPSLPLPDTRPHTSYAASDPIRYSRTFEPDVSSGDLSRQGLSRDDTTTAASHLHDLSAPGHFASQEQFSATYAERHEYSQPKPTRSLGRRFSRKYAGKIMELTNGLGRHAPLPGRMRRASTPHNEQQAAYIDSQQVLVTPVSPSKRNATRPGDTRARKFRQTLGWGDRKDTPAPPSCGNPPGWASRPVYRHPAGPSLNIPPGGERARQTAAAINNPALALAQLVEGETLLAQDDLAARRIRLGSLTSAADSGADLSNFFSEIDEQSCNDSVGPGEEAMDIDDDLLSRHEIPTRRDILQVLPNELVLQIYQWLDVSDLARAQLVSKAWREITNDKSLWRSAFLKKYERVKYTDPQPIQVGGVGIGRPHKRDQEWKDMLKARYDLEANWRRGPERAGKAIYLSGHTDSVYCVQFDEEKIITGSRDRTIRVWDINNFQCLHVIGGPNVRPVPGPKVLRTVDYPAFHLATASVNGTPYGDSVYKVPREYHDASILCLQYDDEILVTGSSDNDLIIWDIKTYEPIKRLRKHRGGVLDVALDSKRIVSCSKDSRIYIWDRKTFECIGELSAHMGPVNAVQLRGKHLVSASGDGIARLWNLEQMKLEKEFPAKERGLAAVEFSEDMRHVLAGGNDHITYKFEVDSGHEVLQFGGHTQLVRSLWLDSANSRVVSGSYDLDLRVYDFVTGQQLWRAEEWTTSWILAAKSDYRRIVATSQDGRILIVDFGLKKGGFEDGQPIDGMDLLRSIENTSAITFRNPWSPGAPCR